MTITGKLSCSTIGSTGMLRGSKVVGISTDKEQYPFAPLDELSKHCLKCPMPKCNARKCEAFRKYGK